MTQSIIFSGAMIRSIIAKRKTQTRRPVNPQPEWDPKYKVHSWSSNRARSMVEIRDMGGAGPYGSYGLKEDVLYVRESWRTWERTDLLDGIRFAADDGFVPIENTVEAAEAWVDANDNGKHRAAWRNPLFMPRWASRITLAKKRIHVERLNEISSEDAIAEGAWCGEDGWMMDTTFVPGVTETSALPELAFSRFYDVIHGPGSWALNPWVWVISFTPTIKEILKP